MQFHGTARGRSVISAPARWLMESGYIHPDVDTLDYGCGRGDLRHGWMWGNKARVWEYEPNHPSDHYYKLPERKFRQIYVGYVLNVLPDKAAEVALINQVLDSLAPWGVAFFSVRRDIPKDGSGTQRWTEPGLIRVRETSRYGIYMMVNMQVSDPMFLTGLALLESGNHSFMNLTPENPLFSKRFHDWFGHNDAAPAMGMYAGTVNELTVKTEFGLLTAWVHWDSLDEGQKLLTVLATLGLLK